MKSVSCLLFIIASVFLISCGNDQDEPKLLFKNSGWFYSYEVYEVQKGDDSLSYSYSNNISGFTTKGSSIRNMVLLSAVKSYEHSKVDLVNIQDSIRHNVYYKGNWNAKAKKQFLKDLLDYYNLALTKKEIQEGFYEIYVADPKKLAQYESKNQNDYYELTTENNRMISKNAPLSRIKNTLKGNVIYKGKNTKKYDFQFVYDSIIANNDYLEKYGLSYRKTKEPVMHYIVKKQ